jgi:hypothetical protein
VHVRRSRAAEALTSLAVLTLSVAGCSSAGPNTSTAVDTSAAASLSAAPTASAILRVYYEENSQVELIAPSGQRIIIDPYTSTRLSSPATASDILLASPELGANIDQPFVDSFPGEKVIDGSGEFTFGDIKVTSIDASQTGDDILSGSAATSHIFVFDFAGFRIAHLGYTDQTHLTDEQLAKLGKVDIAFAILTDVSRVDPDGTRAIMAVEQLQPRLLIPTDVKMTTVQAAGAKWTGTYTTKTSVSIPKDQLPETTSLLFMGPVGGMYGMLLKYAQSTW